MLYASLEINQSNFKDCRIVCEREQKLKKGEIRLRVDRFGITANNITYVALGQAYMYNLFFPTSTKESTLIMPVWGTASVIQSLHSDIQENDRYYGYFPTTSTVVFKVGKVSVNKNFEVYRPQLPADRKVYNEYTKLSSFDPFYSLETEDIMLLFRPLWMTSYLIFDYLQVNKMFSSQSVIISSASSKTSFCLAQLLTMLLPSCEKVFVIGLTSDSNAKWCESLSVYDKIITYKNVENEKFDKTAVYIDIAGDGDLKSMLFNNMGRNLLKGVVVGMSHFDPSNENALANSNTSVGRERTEIFFAPSWIKKRTMEIEPTEIFRRMKAGWDLMIKYSRSWISVKIFLGPENVKQVYLDSLNGKAVPKIGYICSMYNASKL